MLAAFEYQFMFLMACLAFGTPLFQLLLFLASCFKAFDAGVALFKREDLPLARIGFSVVLALFTYHVTESHGAGFFTERDVLGSRSDWLQAAMSWGLAVLWAPAVVLVGCRPQTWLSYSVATSLALGLMGGLGALTKHSGAEPLVVLGRTLQGAVGYAGYAFLAMVPLLLLSAFVWLVLNAGPEPALTRRSMARDGAPD